MQQILSVCRDLRKELRVIDDKSNGVSNCDALVFRIEHCDSEYISVLNEMPSLNLKLKVYYTQ